jgi:hypothetical protein
LGGRRDNVVQVIMGCGLAKTKADGEEKVQCESSV